MGAFEANSVPSMSPLLVFTMMRISSMACAFVAEIAANVKPRRKSVVFIGGNSGTIPGMVQPPVKIGVVQNACTADIAANTAAAERGLREAASRGANIVCFQELFRSLYF